MEKTEKQSCNYACFNSSNPFKIHSEAIIHARFQS